MPSLKDALNKPSNIGEMIKGPGVAAPTPPPIIPREQPGLAIATLGPAPSIWTTEYDRVRQWSRPGTSQNRFPPLPVKANPQVNAATRSVISSIATTNVTETLELQTDGVDNGDQDLLNLEGTLGIVTEDQGDGTVTIQGDGLIHGEIPWETDPSYYEFLEDFDSGNNSTGTVGNHGWTFATVGATGCTFNRLNSLGKKFPYRGNMGIILGGTTANNGSILWPVPSTVFSNNQQNHLWPILDEVNWKCTWVFTPSRITTAGNPGTNFLMTNLSMYVGLGGYFVSAYSARPSYFIGLRYDTDPGITTTLTAAGNASGGLQSLTTSGTVSSFYANGQTVTISGFGNPVNNGTFLVNSAAGTTLSIYNPSGVAETHAGTATVAGIGDTTYHLEAMFNGCTTSGTACRYNNQGTNGGVFDTGITPVEDRMCRLEISSNTVGVIDFSFTDGVTSVSTSINVSRISNQNTHTTSAITNDGHGLAQLLTSPTTGTVNQPVAPGIGMISPAPGNTLTVSGFVGGIAGYNGTYPVRGINSAGTGYGITDPSGGETGIPGVNYYMSGYPGLIPLVTFVNDTAGGTSASARGLMLDFCSFIQNPGLAGNSGGTPNSTLPRYW